ncbi:N-acetylmuramoyl-L-alanine amidase [Brevundimonas diminuta]|uniref:N-acetylmuramoyl-L-alanine amidase n=1 Tax=Brevundimonas diminuta TaxID=293 RepID=UPI001904F12A|nr:N-acetylmuramoyl-L-alanine amidase [Brevundimonas diminuta]MBK1968392.1 N-acetylmuramoyl-L-alanine amidase [Brevundimonas diminuta]
MKIKPRAATRYLVVHCSATRAAADIGAAEIRKWHLQQNWRDIGYHYVIRRDGTVETGRPLMEPGAHVQGHNHHSVGICMVGGLDPKGRAENNFTAEQFASLTELLNDLKVRWPDAEVLGHRDLSPDRNNDGKITRNEWVKECPCFDVKPWWTAAANASAR